jgi:hypothetical protein
VQGEQDAPPAPVGDRPAAQTENRQLLAQDDTVLAAGNEPDQPIWVQM